MNDFYIDLVSNASLSEYPDNTLSRFVNKLSKAIEFEDEWEVAINEIFYPITFLPNDHEIEFSLITVIDDIHTDAGKVLKFVYNAAEHISEILSRINQQIEDLTRTKTDDVETIIPPQIVMLGTDFVHIQTGVVKYKKDVQKEPFKFLYLKFLDKNFHHVLGVSFESYRQFIEASLEKFKTDNQRIFRTAPYDLPNTQISSNLMFIYTDIIRPHLVGDVVSPLLRVAPLSRGQYSSIGHVVFSRPYYFKVSKNRIETISIICVTRLVYLLNLTMFVSS